MIDRSWSQPGFGLKRLHDHLDLLSFIWFLILLFKLHMYFRLKGLR